MKSKKKEMGIRKEGGLLFFFVCVCAAVLFGGDGFIRGIFFVRKDMNI